MIINIQLCMLVELDVMNTFIPKVYLFPGECCRPHFFSNHGLVRTENIFSLPIFVLTSRALVVHPHARSKQT